MAKLFLLLVVVCSPLAFAKDSGGGGSSGGKLKLMSLGFQKGEIVDMGTETVDDFKDLRGGFIGFDETNSNATKFGYRAQLGFLQGNGGSTTTWNQATETDMTLTDFYIDINLVIYLFRGVVNPWITGGTSFGELTMESQVSKESKFHQGYNYGGGIDFLMNDSLGIRLGYYQQYVYSDKIGKMDDRRMTYTNSRLVGALVFSPF
jgi:hypothetical protein